MKIVISEEGKELIKERIQNTIDILLVFVGTVISVMWFIGTLNIIYSVVKYQTFFAGEQQETLVIFSHNFTLLSLFLFGVYGGYRLLRFTKEHIRVIKV